MNLKKGVFIDSSNIMKYLVYEGKNCIMGYAIVRRESLDTYSWIFQNLLACNNGIAPRVMLTDFDPSMAGAIE